MPHQRQVDHQPTVGDGPAGHVVPSAADGDLQSGVTAERDSIAYVGDGLTPPQAGWMVRLFSSQTWAYGLSL